MKMIIIRSLDDVIWERYGDYEWPFIGFYESKSFQEAEKIVTENMEDLGNYYLELVSLDHFNEFKKPYE